MIWISLTCQQEPWKPSLPKGSMGNTKAIMEHNIFESALTSCCKRCSAFWESRKRHSAHVKRQRHTRQRQRHHWPRGCIESKENAKSDVDITGSATIFFLRRSLVYLRDLWVTWRESSGGVVGYGFAVDSNGFYTYQWFALGFVVLFRNYRKRGKSSPQFQKSDDYFYEFRWQVTCDLENSVDYCKLFS